jgi:hypothetical protein
MWMRGLAIWLGAAIIGAIGGTIGAQLIYGGKFGPSDIRFTLGFAAMTLIFTVGGSAFLALVNQALDSRNVPRHLRYAALVLTGGAAGALTLSFLGSSSVAIGAGYGTVTALAWVALLRLTRADSVA